MSATEYVIDLINKQYKSVRQFAIAIDVPYTTIKSGLKAGIGGMSVDTVLKMCEALGIKAEDLRNMPEGQQESPQTEVEEYMDMLRYRPEMRMLFSVSKKATKEEIEQVANMMEAFKKQSEE